MLNSQLVLLRNKNLKDTVDKAKYRESYFSYLQDKTICLGKIIIFVGIPAIIYFVLQDVFVVKISNLIYFRLFFIVPFVAYIVSYFLIFKKYRKLIFYIHTVFLICFNFSMLILVYYFTIHETARVQNICGVINSYTICVFMIFVFSAISKKHFIPIVAVPFILAVVLILMNTPVVDAKLISQLSNPALLIALLGAYSIYNQRQEYNEFLLTKIAQERLEQFENALEENREISRQLLHELEFDHLTNAYNRKAGTKLIEKDIEFVNKNGGIMTFAYIDVDHLKIVNDKHGHEAGDDYLKTIISAVKEKINGNYIIRFGGDEFVIVFKNLNKTESKAVIDDTKQQLSTITNQYSMSYDFSTGYYQYEKEQNLSLSDILKEVDCNMYKEKNLKKSM